MNTQGHVSTMQQLLQTCILRVAAAKQAEEYEL